MFVITPPPQKKTSFSKDFWNDQWQIQGGVGGGGAHGNTPPPPKIFKIMLNNSPSGKVNEQFVCLVYQLFNLGPRKGFALDPLGSQGCPQTPCLQLAPPLTLNPGSTPDDHKFEVDTSGCKVNEYYSSLPS